MVNNDFVLTNKDKEILVKASINPDISSIKKLDKFLELIDNDNVVISEDGIIGTLADDFVDEGNISDNSFQFDNLISFYKESVVLAAWLGVFMEYNESYKKNVMSPLKLEKMYIKSANFKREVVCNKNLKINLAHEIEEKESDKYIITLKVDITNNDSSIMINVVLIGEFVCSERMLIEQNAIAIMFPYLRSYISTLTTQPDLVPIVLQPVNVLSLLNKQ